MHAESPSSRLNDRAGWKLGTPRSRRRYAPPQGTFLIPFLPAWIRILARFASLFAQQSNACQNEVRSNGVPKCAFPLFIQECVWRFNTGGPLNQLVWLRRCFRFLGQPLQLFIFFQTVNPEPNPNPYRFQNAYQGDQDRFVSAMSFVKQLINPFLLTGFFLHRQAHHNIRVNSDI